MQKKFADTYRAAGGDCHYELFENSEHEWTGKPGSQTTSVQEMVRGLYRSEPRELNCKR